MSYLGGGEFLEVGIRKSELLGSVCCFCEYVGLNL